MRKWRKILRVAGKFALWIVAVLVAYALVGTILSLIPVGGSAVPGGDVVVYLMRSDVHTDIAVPTRTERIDWSIVVPPGDTSDKVARE